MRIYKKHFGDYVFFTITTILMLAIAFVTLYPFLYVLFASLSEPDKFLAYKGILLNPVGFSLDAYKAVLSNPNILIGYKNTIFIVGVGTVINVLMTSMGAYFLSRKGPMLKKVVAFLVVITMFIDGGLIPNYLLIKQLHMYDTLWALIIPGAISTFNMIIMKTAFQSIPKGLEEAARIDGASDFVILFKVILPLSLPTMAVIGLYYAVGHWNAWFNANIYIKSASKMPLQLILRNIIINSQVEDMTVGSAHGASYAMGYVIKYATVIVATVPILVIYPFIQKYFVKGVMIGSIKE